MPDDRNELYIDIAPWGPDHSAIRAISCVMLEHPAVQEFLQGGQHRLLSFNLIEPEQKSAMPKPPVRYRATIYDYTHNRTVFVDGCIDDRDMVVLSDSSIQPLPIAEEFQAAVALLFDDPEIGPALRHQRMLVYQPMPPIGDLELPDGRVERILPVGLYSEEGGHRIVGVNLIRSTVLHEMSGTASPSSNVCGPPPYTDCASSGATQQARLTVRRGGTVLWTMTVVRPTASSGTNGSGIELRHVHYRGKQVLYRAHVPILNVQYREAGTGCGPTYRDWQNSETCFEAVGTDPVPGFRLCTSPARTILDTGSDTGNFRGVAIYVAGQEVVLVSELMAGWYRYISEWRLHADGTIRPRFGFSAVNNPCTCNPHHHNVYWRFDFDILTAGSNLVEEFNDPPLFANSHWHRKRYEIRRLKDSARKRKWRISNMVTGDTYEFIPGANDGTADSYGVGDFWVLRYHGNEIDDGQGFTTDPVRSKAGVDRFLNGESIENQDVVLWYAGHFFHDRTHGGGASHIVGPDLIPVRW